MDKRLSRSKSLPPSDRQRQTDDGKQLRRSKSLDSSGFLGVVIRDKEKQDFFVYLQDCDSRVVHQTILEKNLHEETQFARKIIPSLQSLLQHYNQSSEKQMQLKGAIQFLAEKVQRAAKLLGKDKSNYINQLFQIQEGYNNLVAQYGDTHQINKLLEARANYMNPVIDSRSISLLQGSKDLSDCLKSVYRDWLHEHTPFKDILGEHLYNSDDLKFIHDATRKQEKMIEYSRIRALGFLEEMSRAPFSNLEHKPHELEKFDSQAHELLFGKKMQNYLRNLFKTPDKLKRHEIMNGRYQELGGCLEGLLQHHLELKANYLNKIQHYLPKNMSIDQTNAQNFATEQYNSYYVFLNELRKSREPVDKIGLYNFHLSQLEIALDKIKRSFSGESSWPKFLENSVNKEKVDLSKPYF